jgi:hypothetical protein
VSDSDEIATHALPVWRDRANYILQADLAQHGLPGRFEQLWARDVGEGQFELCCLPFLTYGFALGDIVSLVPNVGRFEAILGSLVTRSSHDLLRIASTGQVDRHSELHASLAASGRPHEWRGAGLVAIDIEGVIPDVIWQILEPLARAGDLVWEWGRAPAV